MADDMEKTQQSDFSETKEGRYYAKEIDALREKLDGIKDANSPEWDAAYESLSDLESDAGEAEYQFYDQQRDEGIKL